ncbi:substrate-binding domain-containing protein [Caballeronia sp. ATUFL_M2_KS44]|uniref:substrate-binding domain-containing protein n=1 Tax=Caballeronia sp. ATUFL_M2_KS44 TaxID=2921767 RepID=UPI0020283A65|nr:substrate-binding domain-containing protein [Caballeronia sp. ATUFL_M2_KS44]
MNETRAAITVISSMATRHVLDDLADAYTQRYGQRVAIESVGGVAAARRVQEGEAFDIVVLAADAIGNLAAAGRIDAASRVGIARSGIAMAVAAGASRPSVDTEAAVRHAALAARSIGYSTGPSGAHLMRLFERWDIARSIASRLVQAPPGVGVGALIARGDVELGFQQTSELIGVDGVDVIGSMPNEIQAMTVFEGAVCANARAPQVARSMLQFMTQRDADEVKHRHGMEAAF